MPSDKVERFSADIDNAMPVTGLPDAAEAALSTLVHSQGLKSWKIVNEGRSTVVVLRFLPENGQPYAETSSQYFRRKPPSQLRRDSLRRVSFQQRCGHSSNRPQPHANDDVFRPNCDEVDKTRQEDENKPNTSKEKLHETQAAHASVGARSSRSPSVSSACATAVSGNENCADLIAASTETEEVTTGMELGSEKNGGSEEVTPEILPECFQKLNKRMEDSHRRNMETILSAIHSCVDSLPPAMPSPPPPRSEGLGLGTSMGVDVANASHAAQDQAAPQTEKARVGREKQTASLRRERDSPPVRRFLRSCRR